MEKEIRNLEHTSSELRATKDSRSVQGYGIVFNKASKDLGGFYEIILPEAIAGVIEKSDILALLNHDLSKGILARATNGTGSLNLQTDAKGVKYGFEAPLTSLGDEVIEGIRRGDIRASSFAFNVTKDGEKWERRSDGSTLRTIKKFDRIYDVSPVYREAYADTSVALRSLAEFKKTAEYKRSPKEQNLWRQNELAKHGFKY